MRVLGIETSCDETGVAIYDSERGVLSACLHSQVEIHAEFGGVVPELASRDHIRKTLPLLQEAFYRAKLKEQQIDAIAYTAGPGLVGALLVGAAIANSLAFAWNIPTIPVHHLEAHLLVAMLEERVPSFPFLALLVSGGHTQLVQTNAIGDYILLGETVDDAVGEAFDKVAKILGLPYPGGPALAEIAERGDSKRYHFPRPMINRPGLDFSFSGLKTYALNCFNESNGTEQDRCDIARAFQDAVVDTLAIKCRRALHQTGLCQLVLAGGVSANRALRARMLELGAAERVEIYTARLEYCTDNGVMIAYAGFRQRQAALERSAGRVATNEQNQLAIQVYPRWKMLRD